MILVPSGAIAVGTNKHKMKSRPIEHAHAEEWAVLGPGPGGKRPNRGRYAEGVDKTGRLAYTKRIKIF